MLATATQTCNWLSGFTAAVPYVIEPASLPCSLCRLEQSCAPCPRGTSDVL